MMRIRPALCCLALLGVLWIGAGTGDAAAEGYAWHVADAESTSLSNGTGGSPEAAPEAGERYIWSLDQDLLEVLHPALGTQYRQWLEEIQEEISPKDTVIESVDDRLLQLAVYQERSGDGSVSGAEGRYWLARHRHYDLGTGWELGLSDMFYDGINYIEYINERIALALLGGKGYAGGPEAESLRRPFTGFPRNYPHFRVVDGDYGGRMLALDVETENPFFSLAPSVAAPSLYLPLTGDISPYGLPWVEVTMEYRKEGAGEAHPGMYIASVSLPENPEAETHINKALQELAAQAMAHPLRGISSPDTPLEPMVRYGNGAIAVGYYATEETGGAGYGEIALLAKVQCDLQTGEVLDGREVFAKYQHYLYADLTRRWPGSLAYASDRPETLESYTLPGDALYLGSWVEYNENDGAPFQVTAWYDPAGYEAYLRMWQAHLVPENENESYRNHPGALTFSWDTADSEITTISSGTGGSPENEPIGGERSIRVYPPYAQSMETLYEEEEISDALTAYSRWERTVYKFIEVADEFSAIYEVDGRLRIMALRGRAYADFDELYDYGYGYLTPADHAWLYNRVTDWRVRTWVMDMGRQEQLLLSDMFYDGVNYIRYINEYLAGALLGNPGDVEHDAYALGESALRRPFTGLPRNYPWFHLIKGPYGGRMLVLEIDAEDPLFDADAGKWRPALYVPLPDTLSPYGARWVGVDMTLRPLPDAPGDAGKYGIYLAQVRAGDGLSEAAAERINAGLEALSEQASAHPLLHLHDSYHGLNPRTSYTEKYLSAAYYAEVDDTGVNPRALLAAGIFDLDTGERLDGEALWRALSGAPGAVMYRHEAGRGYGGYPERWVEDRMEEGSALPEGAIYLGTDWIKEEWLQEEQAWTRRLQVAYLAPDGYEWRLDMGNGDGDGLTLFGEK